MAEEYVIRKQISIHDERISAAVLRIEEATGTKRAQFERNAYKDKLIDQMREKECMAAFLEELAEKIEHGVSLHPNADGHLEGATAIDTEALLQLLSDCAECQQLPRTLKERIRSLLEGEEVEG